MYKIINTNSGELVGYTESPIWIRKHKNGCYVQTERKKAEGIAFNSTPYSIGGLDGLDIVVVVEENAGTIIRELQEENSMHKAQINAQSEQMDFYEDCIAEMASVVYA